MRRRLRLALLALAGLLAAGRSFAASIACAVSGVQCLPVVIVDQNGNVPPALTITPSAVLPVMSTEEANVRAGKGFTVTVQSSLTANQYLTIRIANTGSKTVFQTLRKISHNANAILTVTKYVNSGALAGAATVTPINRWPSNATTSSLSPSYKTGTASAATGTAGPVTYIPSGGQDTSAVLTVIPPGVVDEFEVQAPAGLGTTDNVAFNFVEFEE